MSLTNDHWEAKENDWQSTLPPEGLEELRLWKAAKAQKELEEECPHDELDHGICMDCGKDCFDDVIAAAEFRADSLEDR